MSYPGTTPGVAGRFRRLSRRGRLLILLVALTTIGLPLVLVINDGTTGPFAAGDCLAGQSPETFQIVPCDSAVARWRVLARLDGRSEADFNQEECRDHPRTTTAFYLHGHRFSRGYVLCLEALR
ncbi:MAG TPA: hypothetical protein VIL44_12320 [Micromonospora sp.]